MRHSFPIALALVVAGSASAQQTISVLINNASSVVVSPRQCDERRTISWSASTYTGWCTGLQIWVTTGQCGDAPVAGDTPVFNDSFQATDRTNQLRVSDLPIFQQADAGYACGAAVNQVHRICASSTYPSGFQGCGSPATVRGTNPPTIEYRGRPPDPPTITSVAPLDGALRVQVNANSDTVLVHLQFRVAGTDEFADGGQFSTSANGGKIDGLNNGTLYDVRVYGEDAAGNLSNPSDISQGTPVASEGFYTMYRRDGGADLGGCGDVGGGGIDWRLILGVGLLPLLRRRRSCRRDS